VLKGRFDKLKEERDDLDGNNFALKNDIDSLKETIYSLEQSKQEITNKLEDEITSLKRKAVEYKSQIDNGTQETSNQKGVISDLNFQINELRSDY
jgi:uncharacterized coiled-coil DUF342 family protein